MSKITLVTGLWNIQRDTLTEGWNRSFEHYTDKFKELLEVPYNLFIFGEDDLEDVVWSIRNKDNTIFVKRSSDWFKNVFFDKIQHIRKDPKWYSQASWLADSTQAKLEMYNPLVMSKMFLLNDARLMESWESDYLFWVDAGLTNTVHKGYFTHDKVLDKLPSLINDFLFVPFPYEAQTEIHGFSYPDINDFASQDVKLVCRGGFFGGKNKMIESINSKYYDIMMDTLNKGYMGTEESLFSILMYKYPTEIGYSKINGDGLLNTFFENLKEDKVKVEYAFDQGKVNYKNTGVYIITFNSPAQVEMLIKSFLDYDKDFIDLPKKYLLNNSTDANTDIEYQQICSKYGFEEIKKKDNLGICGGRQFIAEHFDQTTLDYYFFFEDDMNLINTKEVCKNGFSRYSHGLFKKSLDITHMGRFDFLKLCYTEFYGDNSVQWAWYNLPQNKREEYFPHKKKLPKQGLDPDAPRTKFKNIFTYYNLSYITGEIYYCNWPQVVSRAGNKKMFLEEKWAHPFEQTWMSYMYQKTVEGHINPALLLLSPVEHNRFDHYDGEKRKEN